MRVASVAKARALALLEVGELNVGGKVRFADCVVPLVERYGFLVFPREPNDFDLAEKGVRFESGKDSDITIDSLVIYNGAMYIDTFSSTDDSQRILLDMLAWGRDHLGLTYSPKSIRKWGYISQVIFETDFPLLPSLSYPLANLAEKTSAVTRELWDGLEYEPNNVSIGHDPRLRKNGIASFFIQHRINTRFDENKYYSEAPLPTSLHVQFLEELEADVLEYRK